MAANARYLSESVTYYNDGGLKRAAYLMETFFATAHAGGGTEAAALHAVIWEVLDDETPNVSLNHGDHFIRTDPGNNPAKKLAAQVPDRANIWLGNAAAAHWGGAADDPGNHMLFWLNPTALSLNQGVITLNPEASTFSAVPEPDSSAMIAGGLAMVVLLRRRY